MFSQEEKLSFLLVVYNYILFNKYNILSQHPIYWLEEIIEVIIKLRFKLFLSSEVTNNYSEIYIKEFNYNKTGFMIPNCQWIYLKRIYGQTKPIFTYFQFWNTVFELLPIINKVLTIPTIIVIRKNALFCLHMDDHSSLTSSLENTFLLLHESNFSLIVLRLVYLIEKKKYTFPQDMNILGFGETSTRLWLSTKHETKRKN